MTPLKTHWQMILCRVCLEVWRIDARKSRELQLRIATITRDVLFQNYPSGPPFGLTTGGMPNVDCQNCAKPALYLHRHGVAHPHSEPGRDSAHADRHLSQYQYSCGCRGLDLFRLKPCGDGRARYNRL